MEIQEWKHPATLLTESRMKQSLGSAGNSRNKMSVKRLGIIVVFLPHHSPCCGLNCVSLRHIEVLTSRTCECDLIWKWGFCRCNHVKAKSYCPGWCGSVDWVLACKPEGHWFDSQSGHMPELQARSPVGGVQEATTHWCFSLSLSFLSPLSKNM